MIKKSIDRKELLVASFVVALLFFVIPPLFSQNVDQIDVVITKDGTIYKGTIIEDRTYDFLRIQIANGSILRIEYSQIDIIRKEEAPKPLPVITVQPSNDEQIAKIKTAFSGLSPAKLKSTDFSYLGLSNISKTDKMAIYNSVKKQNSFLIFGLNLILPLGIGSFIQGNTGYGIYQLISVSSLALLDQMSSDDVVGYIILTNAIASYVGGLIVPFTYESNYNKLLQSTLDF